MAKGEGRRGMRTPEHGRLRAAPLADAAEYRLRAEMRGQGTKGQGSMGLGSMGLGAVGLGATESVGTLGTSGRWGGAGSGCALLARLCAAETASCAAGQL